jgi:hypothetical protein
MWFYVGLALILASLALLIHHGVHHSGDDPESHAKQESCWYVCYFQPSDVGNFRTCNHEMWIIALFAAGALCMAAGNRLGA